MKPEEKARQTIDELLDGCGWVVQDKKRLDLSAARGVAVREVALQSGHGEVDYLLFADAKGIGTVEAKPEGWTLRGVESQSDKYVKGMPEGVPAWRSPMPFSYESTGIETHFTNKLEPDARSREVFAFHRPETLVEWVQEDSTLRERLRHLPPLITDALWPPQIRAIENLERSFALNRPRALIQMATGSGKTFTAINAVYRLIKFANAKRILFLVDRGNLGRQAYKEFQQFVTPDDGRKFTELYNVQHLKSNKLDPVSRVCITTIQRLYSMLKGEEELPPDLDEASGFELEDSLFKEPMPVEYNEHIPIETFDFIITDECHRSIYNLWRQVLEYFDASLIGLTATPSKQTLGFFKQNLVMEYNHEQAVADGVNVQYEVYRIRTEITERGSRVESGFYVDRRDRASRKVRWEQLDEDLIYDANQLDRAVVAADQIRTVIRTFRDKLFTEIFPGRSDVPKTLIYAKDDSHADDIVQIVREEFGKGNDFCQKITYKTTGVKTEDLIASFRNSYNPRIAVTVDLIATGTDIKPLEIVFFMRSVKSRTFFEQMKGRGVRVIPDTELQAVTPGVKGKDHFIIVDAVGVCERDKTDSRPLERKRTVTLEKLLQTVAFGNRNKDVLASLAGRLARLDRQCSEGDKHELVKLSGGESLNAVTRAIIDAVDPDRIEETAKATFNTTSPTAKQRKEAAAQLANSAVEALATKPEFRNKLVELHRSFEQTIDTVSVDRVTAAGYDQAALDAARKTIQSFEQFIAEHKDEITALEILYSRPRRRPLSYADIRDLAEAIEKPPRRWTPDALWRAYEALDRSKVRGASGQRLLTDIVSLVKFALQEEHTLRPYTETVNERFDNWLARQSTVGRQFTEEQIYWIELIRDHIATSLSIELDDFEFAPFNQKGGLGRAYQLFGPELPKVLEELNEVLAA
ncbi:MAG TPA: type I restriction-modification enzyme R subunit C-terminal domain-containing protein [Blastocatellia bacterium]|nr:type I restriction-modification enzyme R subunit C-terminal domain-containing protein [Blastocatellia bacterium]